MCNSSKSTNSQVAVTTMSRKTMRTRAHLTTLYRHAPFDRPLPNELKSKYLMEFPKKEKVTYRLKFQCEKNYA
jgi:hypothetical protein